MIDTTSGAALPSKRQLEHVLRDAGLSARQAKKLLSGGYSALGAEDDNLAEIAEQLDALSQRLRHS